MKEHYDKSFKTSITTLTQKGKSMRKDTPIQVRLSQDMLSRIDKLKDELEIARTELIRTAINEYIKKHNRKQCAELEEDK